MKQYYLLTPGPTPVPQEVLQQTALPILHHRTYEFGEIFVEVIEGLKYVLQTKNDVFLISCSGTGAMESAVANLLSPQEKAIVATSGVFGNRWIKILNSYNVNVIPVEFEWGSAVQPQKILEVLKQNPDSKALFTTHTETSTGTVNPLKEIGEIIKDFDAVFVVDAISGLGGEELRTDQWNIDVCVSASQKGLMSPPGIGFVSVSAKAWQFVEKSKNSRFYFDWRTMKKFIPQKQTPYTPPVSLIVGMKKAIEMIKKEGLEKNWENTKILAKACREGVRALNLKIFAKNPCNVLTAAVLPQNIDGQRLIDFMRDEYGVSIAGGQEKLKGKIIRIAHMGFIGRFDLIVGLSAVEMALEKFGYKLKSGAAVGAALEILRQS